MHLNYQKRRRQINAISTDKFIFKSRTKPLSHSNIKYNWSAEAAIIAKLCSLEVMLPIQWYDKPIHTIPVTLDQKLAWALLKYSIADCTTGPKWKRLKYIAEIENWLAGNNDPIYTSEYWVEQLGINYSFFVKAFKKWLSLRRDELKGTPSKAIKEVEIIEHSCPQGHRMDKDNTRWNGRGSVCRICRNNRAKLYMRKKRAKE